MNIPQLHLLLEAHLTPELTADDVAGENAEYLTRAGLTCRAFLDAHAAKLICSPEGDLLATTPKGDRVVRMVLNLATKET